MMYTSGRPPYESPNGPGVGHHCIDTEEAMIRPNRMWGAAVALLCAHGAAVAGVSPDAAQDLAKKSGLWSQLDSLGSQVGEGMSAAAQKSAGKVSVEQQAKLLGCAQSAYATEGLRKTALDAVAGGLQAADVPVLVAWYDSPIGHKIALVEHDSSELVTDPQERVRRGAAALASGGAARQALLQAIVTKSHSVEMMTNTVIEMTLAVEQGMASVNPPAAGNFTPELKARLESRRPQIVGHYAEISLDAYAFTYGALADEELQRYADFLGSASGAAFNDATMRGVARAMNSGSMQLARCLQGVKPTKG